METQTVTREPIIEIPADISRQVDATAGLRHHFDAVIREERTRYATWRRDADRRSGVHISGWSPPPFVERTAADLMAEAERRLVEQQQFQMTPEGRFIIAIADAERALQAITAALVEARSARERSWTGEREKIAKWVAAAEQKAFDLSGLLNAAWDCAK